MLKIQTPVPTVCKDIECCIVAMLYDMCRWYRRQWRCRPIPAAKLPMKTWTCLPMLGRFKSMTFLCSSRT